MNRENTAPTTAQQFYDENHMAYGPTCRGHYFTLRKVSVTSLYMMGLLPTTRDKSELAQAIAGKSPEEVDRILTEDQKKSGIEFLHIVIREGISSVNIITDPLVEADPEKNEVHIRSFDPEELNEVALAIARFSGISELLEDIDDAGGRDKEPERAGVSE